MEKTVDKQFDVSSNKDVRDDKNAVEIDPLFLRNFDFVLDQVYQNVFKVRYDLFFVLLAFDVESAMGDDLDNMKSTFLKIKSGFDSTLRAYSP